MATAVLKWSVLGCLVLALYVLVLGFRRLACRDLYILDLVDLSLLLIVASEIASYIFSIYRPNSLRSLVVTLISVCFCIIVRAYPASAICSRVVHGAITLAAGMLAFRTIPGALLHVQSLRTGGFTDIHSLRAFIPYWSPGGIPCAFWASFLLALLPFVLIWLFTSRRSKLGLGLHSVMALLVVAALNASLSRGVLFAVLFLEAAAIGTVFWAHVMKLRALSVVSSILLIVTLVAATPILNETLTSLKIVHTESQVRSLTGRRQIWGGALLQVKDKPLTGLGGKNYALLASCSRSRGEQEAFVGNAFCTPIQLVVEKGLFGLVSYGILFACVLAWSVRRLRGQPLPREFAVACALFAAGLCALALRDLTCSSFMSYPPLMLVAAYMMGHNTQKAAERLSSRWSTAVSDCVLIGLFAVAAVAVYSDRAIKAGERNATDFVSTLDRGDLWMASKALGRAVDCERDNALYQFYAGVLAERGVSRRFDAQKFVEGSLAYPPQDIVRLNTAREYCQRAISINPRDEAFYANLAWTYALLRQMPSALEYIRTAIATDSTISLNHVSYGLFREAQTQLTFAESEYSEALVIDPALVESPFFLDFAKRCPASRARTIVAAVRKLELKLAAQADPVSQAKLARLYALQGEEDKARRLWRLSLNQLPGLPRVWMHLGDLELQKEDCGAALDCYRKAALLNPQDPLICMRMAGFLENMGRQVEGRAWQAGALGALHNPTSVHALRAGDVYGLSYHLNDDAVPTGLLAYTSPADPAPRSAGPNR